MTPEKARKIMKVLNGRYRTDKVRMDPFRVLMHVVLAPRTTDLVSWPAADRLVKVGRTFAGVSRMDVRRIERIILPTNYYKTKARRIKAACRFIQEKHGGRVPRTREELMEIPGVGGKSADIVLAFCFSQPVIAVDAHVKWIANVTGMSSEKTPEKIRADLHRIFPERDRAKANDIMVQFGKEICYTGRPKCWMCPIEKMCPYQKKRTSPGN